MDDHGVSLAPAMLCIFLLLKYQVRCSETLKQMQRLRPRVRIGRNVWRGVDLLQQVREMRLFLADGYLNLYVVFLYIGVLYFMYA